MVSVPRCSPRLPLELSMVLEAKKKKKKKIKGRELQLTSAGVPAHCEHG